MPYRHARNTVSGQLKLPTQGSSGGILIGDDVLLYRGAAGWLYLADGDSFQIATTGKLQFRDAAIYINSAADGYLNLMADTGIGLAADTQLTGNKKLIFRDAAIYINSSTDGRLDIVADTMITLQSPIVEVMQYLKHFGDSDTYAIFETNSIKVQAGDTEGIAINATGVGFLGATPTAAMAHLADPTDLATCITAITQLIDDQKALGLMAADP